MAEADGEDGSSVHTEDAEDKGERLRGSSLGESVQDATILASETAQAGIDIALGTLDQGIDFTLSTVNIDLNEEMAM